MRSCCSVRGARCGARPERDQAERDQAERGQATVELALVLPLFVILFVAVLQVAVIARAEMLVVHAARDGAREATVTANAARITDAATRTLPGARVRVVRRGVVGDPVEVNVEYTVPMHLPLLGAVLPDLTLHAHAVMRVEKR